MKTYKFLVISDIVIMFWLMIFIVFSLGFELWMLVIPMAISANIIEMVREEKRQKEEH